MGVDGVGRSVTLWVIFEWTGAELEGALTSHFKTSFFKVD